VALGQQPHHGKELKATPNPAAKNGIMASAGYKLVIMGQMKIGI
jgi:hypothetical protein